MVCLEKICYFLSFQMRNLGLPELNQALWTSSSVLKSICFVPVAFKLQPALSLLDVEGLFKQILGLSPGVAQSLKLCCESEVPTLGSTALGHFFLVLVHDKVFIGLQENEKNNVWGFS